MGLYTLFPVSIAIPEKKKRFCSEGEVDPMCQDKKEVTTLYYFSEFGDHYTRNVPAMRTVKNFY